MNRGDIIATKDGRKVEKRLKSESMYFMMKEKSRLSNKMVIYRIKYKKYQISKKKNILEEIFRVRFSVKI